MSPRMRERPSTAGTCFRSPRIASRRSIQRPAKCSPRSRRPAAAVTPDSRGPKGRSGWPGFVIGIAESHGNVDDEAAAGGFGFFVESFDESAGFGAGHIGVGAAEVGRDGIRVANGGDAGSG